VREAQKRARFHGAQTAASWAPCNGYAIRTTGAHRKAAQCPRLLPLCCLPLIPVLILPLSRGPSNSVCAPLRDLITLIWPPRFIGRPEQLLPSSWTAQLGPKGKGKKWTVMQASQRWRQQLRPTGTLWHHHLHSLTRSPLPHRLASHKGRRFSSFLASRFPLLHPHPRLFQLLLVALSPALMRQMNRLRSFLLLF